LTFEYSVIIIGLYSRHIGKVVWVQYIMYLCN
jgi:hypothetical protein